MTHHTDERATLLKIERSLMGRSLDEWVMETGAVALNSSWHGELAAIVRMAFDKGVEVEQAARRAPAVQPDQLPPDAAKRAMEELQTEVEKLRSALAECRDACPIPKPGASNEEAWMQSIGDPESVPAFVKSCFGAPAVPVPQGWRELAERCLSAMEQAVHFRKNGEGRPPEQTCLFEIQDLRAALAAAPQPPEAVSHTALETNVAAPVLMPEPVAAESRFTTFAGDRWRWCTVEHARAFGADKGYEVRYLYTEQQVRQLLAQKG